MVELLTVVSILVIILGIAAPSMSEFLAAQQAKGMSYDLTGDLMLARNEALKRNASVTISPAVAGWAQGWSVSSVSGGVAESLSTRNAAAQSVTVIGAPATITFDFNGRVSSPVGRVGITIRSQSSFRCVQLDPSGRARAVHGACA
jgi:type IV fimbrial biogenesis protein FimT